LTSSDATQQTFGLLVLPEVVGSDAGLDEQRVRGAGPEKR
jgi:hypothetical protein